MEITLSEFESVMRLVASSIGQVMTPEKASEIIAVLRGTNGYPIDHTQFPQEDAGAYTLACEPFAKTEEMEALHAAYHAATDDTGAPLDYDYDRMYRMWCVGSMVQFVARGAGNRPSRRRHAAVRRALREDRRQVLQRQHVFHLRAAPGPDGAGRRPVALRRAVNVRLRREKSQFHIASEAKARLLRSQIEAATTAAEVDAVTW